MLLNRADPEIGAKLGSEIAKSSLAEAVCAALEVAPEPFEIDRDAAGLEARACSVLPTGVPNRARLKVFSPRSGHTLVFFYKKSLVPYSRDRYSYGGIDLKDGDVAPQEVAQWVEFVTSGFHPDKRPEKLRRAFPYEIPD